MNNERMTFLIAYLDGLTTLTANEYRCNTEIAECIGWIREEFKGTSADSLERNISGPATVEIHEGHSAKIVLWKDDVNDNE